jgi:hypothetical protein
MKNIVLALVLAVLITGFVKAQDIGTVGSTVINDEFVTAMKFVHPDFFLMSDSVFVQQNLGKSYVLPMILADTARKLGLDKEPSVKRQLDIVRKIVEDSYLAMIYEQNAIKNTEVSDIESKKYYDDHASQFTEWGYNSFLQAKITDTSAAIVKQVKDLLLSYSRKDTLLEGLRINADRKYFIYYEKRPGNMEFDPVFRSVKEAKQGEVSGPVTMGGTKMLSVLISKTPDKIKPFEEVKDLCRENVRKTKSSQAIDEYKKKAYAKYPIKVNKEYFSGKR